MSDKIFPIDYSTEELKEHIKEQLNKLNKSFLPEGEQHRAEMEITLCQNQLVAIETIEGNKRLQDQQTILTNILTNFIKAEKNATMLTWAVIGLTLVTLIATCYLEVRHSDEESGNLKTIIQCLTNENKKIDKELQLINDHQTREALYYDKVYTELKLMNVKKSKNVK